jgi:hypothetical protein
LQRSLDNPHSDSDVVAEAGFSEWADQAAAGDQELLDSTAGKEIRWDADRGWIEADE